MDDIDTGYAIDGDIEDSGSEGDGPYKKKKRVIELEVGQDGRPLLPDTVADGSLAFDDLHPIVREYMTMNYSLHTFLTRIFPLMLTYFLKRAGFGTREGSCSMGSYRITAGGLHRGSISSIRFYIGEGSVENEQDSDLGATRILV